MSGLDTKICVECNEEINQELPVMHCETCGNEFCYDCCKPWAKGKLCWQCKEDLEKEVGET